MIPPLLERLGKSFVLLESPGQGRIALRPLFPEVHPLDPALVEDCRAHKPELLAYLGFAERADALLLESTLRLGKAWPEGCQLEDDPRWGRAERELRDASWSLDLKAFKTVIATRERLAHGVFMAFKKERAR